MHVIHSGQKIMQLTLSDYQIRLAESLKSILTSSELHYAEKHYLEVEKPTHCRAEMWQLGQYECRTRVASKRKWIRESVLKEYKFSIRSFFCVVCYCVVVYSCHICHAVGFVVK